MSLMIFSAGVFLVNSWQESGCKGIKMATNRAFLSKLFNRRADIYPIFVGMAELTYEIKVNGAASFQVQVKEEQLLLDGTPAVWSCEPMPDGSFSILYGHRSLRGEIAGINPENKEVTVKIDGQLYQVQMREPVDRLLESMGIGREQAPGISHIKAPMPGMILRVLVSPGQQLKKGDPVLVLEAMKMENVFKAPEDAVVREIPVKEGAAVEKGQVLVILA